MIHIEHSVQINRPREEVFDFLADFENIPRWQSNVIRSVPVSSGAIRVGFQFEETIKLMMRKVRAVCTVTEVVANQRMAFEMRSNGPIDCDASFRLQAEAGGTRLTLVGVARLKGVWRLLQPMIGAELRKETLAELIVLKGLLDPSPVLVTQATS